MLLSDFTDPAQGPTGFDPLGVAVVPAPVNQAQLDHFLCYKTKPTAGTPKFQPILGVTVDDQFITDPGNAFDLKQPTQLCTPVDKNGEDHTLGPSLAVLPGEARQGATQA
jgi:hypothetical protein